MNFFVKIILLVALLYATLGNGATVKRKDASWRKGYDYVSEVTKIHSFGPQGTICTGEIC
jgi:hypothetical protein